MQTNKHMYNIFILGLTYVDS